MLSGYMWARILGDLRLSKKTTKERIIKRIIELLILNYISMAKKTIWLVNTLPTYGIRTYYAFDSEEKAKAKYKEIVNYFRNHDKPDDKDHWSYKVTYESEEVKFTLFDATLNDEIQHFKVIYLPLEVQ